MATNPTKVRFSSEVQKERMERYGYAMGFRTVADFLLHATENYITRNKLSKDKKDHGDKVYEEIKVKKAKN